MANDASLTNVNRASVVFAAALMNLDSGESRRAYSRGIAGFLCWARENSASDFNKLAVLRYRDHLRSEGLAASTINQVLSAIRSLASEAADAGLLDSASAAAIRRVPGVSNRGERTGVWLSPGDAALLLAAPDTNTLRGVRDRAILAVLLHGGLRRSEVVSVEVSQFRQTDGRWVLADLRGKGNRLRTVPLNSEAAWRVRAWLQAAGISDGPLFRSFRRGDHPTKSGLTGQAVYNLVASYAGQLGLRLRPHDCRRTFAQLARRGRATIDQIQLSLGHASVATTERYLNTAQDMADTPSDAVLRASA